MPGSEETVIYYTYDPLYRLTAADYSNGDLYHYSYDSVGNRLTQENMVNGLSSTVNYAYDIANRLTDVGGVSYMYDANGNLLSDGQNTYAYDSANRLVEVSNQSSVSSYRYNGLGDRLSQTVDGIATDYTVDLNTGLTQVLYDGTNTYIYGLGRISQQNGSTPEYFLGDALGSVRQLTNNSGEVTLAKSYDPYGEILSSNGNGTSAFAYTGETTDASGLTYLRARYYNPVDGRFVSRDTFAGNYNSPQSLNRWNYTQSNPINYTDPTGLFPCPWNVGLNTCDINDWANWLFRDLYTAYDINTNMYVPTNSGPTNFTGAVTNKYLKDIKPGTVVIYKIADTGLDFFPMAAYPLSQALIGGNLLGEGLDQEERLTLTFWGIVGLDCFPGLRFAPDGVNIGGEIPILPGQKHHILSNKIFAALNNHPILKGVFNRDDYLVRASTLLDHKGYQKWHIEYDFEVVEWLAEHSSATRDDFFDFLREVYSTPSMRKAFPDALNIIE